MNGRAGGKRLVGVLEGQAIFMTSKTQPNWLEQGGGDFDHQAADGGCILRGLCRHLKSPGSRALCFGSHFWKAMWQRWEKMDSGNQGWNRRLGTMRCGQSNLDEREGLREDTGLISAAWMELGWGRWVFWSGTKYLSEHK